MPDITMCNNSTCSSRRTCYRYMAMPTPSRQSYAHFPTEEWEDKCDQYWSTAVHAPHELNHAREDETTTQ